MYRITMACPKRTGVYAIDPNNDSFIRENLDIITEMFLYESDGEKITFTIRDEETGTYIERTFISLYGTPREIVSLIDEDFPIAKIESDRIFAQLDHTDLDEKVCIVYSPNPNSRVILRSAIYRTLMASVSAIISDAFKIPVDDIRLLHDEKDPLFQNNT